METKIARYALGKGILGSLVTSLILLQILENSQVTMKNGAQQNTNVRNIFSFEHCVLFLACQAQLFDYIMK